MDGLKSVGNKLVGVISRTDLLNTIAGKVRWVHAGDGVRAKSERYMQARGNPSGCHGPEARGQLIVSWSCACFCSVIRCFVMCRLFFHARAHDLLLLRFSLHHMDTILARCYTTQSPLSCYG